MGDFSPVTFDIGNVNSVTEMNKTRPFKPVNRAGVCIWENSSPVTEIRDLGIPASPPSHMNTTKFLQRKEW